MKTRMIAYKKRSRKKKKGFYGQSINFYSSTKCHQKKVKAK